MIITIDGPVASGKSSVAKAIAKELEIYYLYTGLLYRAVAYVLKEDCKDGENFEEFFKKITPEQLAFIKDIAYDYGKDDTESRPYIFYKDQEITEKLYSSSLSQPASVVSANKNVRDLLLDLQRDVAKRYDIVADGRDCGSVLFPDADHKFYLTASTEIRAQRLLLDERRGAMGESLEKVKAEVEERDRRDQEREIAPLTIPEGATVVDNSQITLQETIKRFLDHIK